MDNLDKNLPIIQQLLGEQLGHVFGIIIVIVFLYNYFFKSEIFQHFFIFINLKSWKISKEISVINEMISNSSIHATTLKNLEYRLNVLYLQNFLNINEPDLNKLEYLNGYKDVKKAIVRYKRCSKKLIFDLDKNTLFLSEKNSTKLTEKQADFIINWAFLFYFSLTFPPALCIPYLIHNQDNNLQTINYILLYPFTFILFCSWVFLVAFVVRFFFQRANAVKLLNMDRI